MYIIYYSIKIYHNMIQYNIKQYNITQNINNIYNIKMLPRLGSFTPTMQLTEQVDNDAYASQDPSHGRTVFLSQKRPRRR